MEADKKVKKLLYIKSVVNLCIEGVESWVTIEIIRLCIIGIFIFCLINNNELSKMLGERENQILFLQTITSFSAFLFFVITTIKNIILRHDVILFDIYREVIVPLIYLILMPSRIVSIRYFLFILFLCKGLRLCFIQCVVKPLDSAMGSVKFSKNKSN